MISCIKKYFLFLCLCPVLAGCITPGADVEMAEPAVRALGVERLEIKNCENLEDRHQMLAEDFQVEKFIRIADLAQGVRSGESISIPTEMKEQLAAAVDKTYQMMYEAEVEKLNATELVGPGDMIRLYRIQILEKIWTSKVSFRMAGKLYVADYAYELHVPNSLGFWEITCLG